MIEASGLVYEYPGMRALDDVSFSLPERSITALVGPNGAGKTTLLRCLAALDEPFAGGITVAGIDVLHQPRQAHRQIGYLPDDFGLYADLSVRQCLLYAGRARGLDEAELVRRVPQVVAELGLAERLPEKAGTLSRGQRQRLAIAQAVIHRPRVLLLDEPASGLDPESRASLSGLMRSLRDGGMTLVVSSHILAELEEYCTGMLVLQRGRVVEHRLLDFAQVPAVRRVRLRLARPAAQLAEALGQCAGVGRVAPAPDTASFEFAGDDAALAALLGTLVAQGLAVCELAVEQDSLQDAYLAAVGAAWSAR
ncbi:MAG: ABC transporter ATP-binding protein [Nevskia sp.]|nr:ABC transporter ATP-binding protein [Nevskia sp.]